MLSQFDIYSEIQYSEFSMRKVFIFLLALVIVLGVAFAGYKFLSPQFTAQQEVASVTDTQAAYWFVLYRSENKEELYWGVPGIKEQSGLVRTFSVKTGIPGERPTPLPTLLGKKYWRIIEKHAEMENPETAPYFLTLDIPAPSEAPYGPTPYTECNGVQCDWVRPGNFGLHGIGGDPNKLSTEDPGSSGCIRHKDEDITYLYELLDPSKGEIRYYIEA